MNKIIISIMFLAILSFTNTAQALDLSDAEDAITWGIGTLEYILSQIGVFVETAITIGIIIIIVALIGLLLRAVTIIF